MSDRTFGIIAGLLTLAAIAAWAVYFELAPVDPPRSVPRADTPAFEAPLPPVAITAVGAVVYDAATDRVLFAKNPELQLPLASVTKLALPIVLAGEGGTNLTISPRDLATEGESSLQAGERWQVADLLALTLTMSINDGASALASVAAASDSVDLEERLRSLPRELGLAQTYFLNPTGLDVSSTTAGAYGSALDMAKLMEAALARNPEALEATALSVLRVASQTGESHTAINTNPDVSRIPGLIASKTGYTDLAGGNLVIAVDLGFYHPVIISILGSGYEERFADALALIRAARENLHAP